MKIENEMAVARISGSATFTSTALAGPVFRNTSTSAMKIAGR